MPANNAQESYSCYGDQVKYVKSGYGDEPLDKTLSDETANLDVIVSHFSIYHQPDNRKQELYQEIFNFLSSGGVFTNIEHVSVASVAMKTAFENYMIDQLYSYQLKKGKHMSRKDAAWEFRARHEKKHQYYCSGRKPMCLVALHRL